MLDGDMLDGALPVHEHQVVPQQSAAALRPEDFDQAARVQRGVHVQGVRQLVHRLRTKGELPRRQPATHTQGHQRTPRTATLLLSLDASVVR